MINVIVQAVAFAAWIAFTCPPLAESKNKTARWVHGLCRVLVGAGIGWAFGSALSGVLI
jgi:hypothetical protein